MVLRFNISERGSRTLVGALAIACFLTACGTQTQADTGTPDSGARDATTPTDIGAPDVGEDAGDFDGAIDAGPPQTDANNLGDALPAGCVRERCNRTDDDCDGRVDEGACGRCESFARGDHTYLSCPVPALGVDYLGLSCESAGPGYHPVRFETVEEIISVDSHASGWVGYFRGLDGEFRDSEGAALPALLFAPGTPAARNLTRNCLYVENGELHDSLCTIEERPFFCEGEIVRRDAPQCVPAAEVCDLDDDDCDGRIDEGSCGSCDTARFVGHDYLICTQQGMGWDAARARCNELSPGSDLAVLDSFDEGISLAQQASFTGLDLGYWIGHGDRANEGQYLSLDGRELPLQWSSNEPNNLNGMQDCVSVYAGGFIADIGCEVAFDFICERRSIVGP